MFYIHDKLYAYAQIAYNEAQNNNVFGFRMVGKMPQNNEFIKLFFVNIRNERQREQRKKVVIPKRIHTKRMMGTMLIAKDGQIKC